MFTPSPLETLAAFALAFMAGALLILGLDHYIHPHQRHTTPVHHPP